MTSKNAEKCQFPLALQTMFSILGAETPYKGRGSALCRKRTVFAPPPVRGVGVKFPIFQQIVQEKNGRKQRKTKKSEEKEKKQFSAPVQDKKGRKRREKQRKAKNKKKGRFPSTPSTPTHKERSSGGMVCEEYLECLRECKRGQLLFGRHVP